MTNSEWIRTSSCYMSFLLLQKLKRPTIKQTQWKINKIKQNKQMKGKKKVKCMTKWSKHSARENESYKFLRLFHLSESGISINVDDICQQKDLKSWRLHMLYIHESWTECASHRLPNQYNVKLWERQHPHNTQQIHANNKSLLEYGGGRGRRRWRWWPELLLSNI